MGKLEARLRIPVADRRSAFVNALKQPHSLSVLRASSVNDEDNDSVLPACKLNIIIIISSSSSITVNRAFVAGQVPPFRSGNKGARNLKLRTVKHLHEHFSSMNL